MRHDTAILGSLTGRRERTLCIRCTVAEQNVPFCSCVSAGFMLYFPIFGINQGPWTMSFGQAGCKSFQAVPGTAGQSLGAFPWLWSRPFVPSRHRTKGWRKNLHGHPWTKVDIPPRCPPRSRDRYSSMTGPAIPASTVSGLQTLQPLVGGEGGLQKARLQGTQGARARVFGSLTGSGRPSSVPPASNSAMALPNTVPGAMPRPL